MPSDPDGATSALDAAPPHVDAGPSIDADPGPPHVVRLEPSRDETGVIPDSPIRVTFDQDMLCWTVQGAFAIENVAGAVSCDGPFAYFHPDDRLPLLQSFHGVIGGLAASAAGHYMDATVDWTFTTRDGAWQAPAILVEDAVARARLAPRYGDVLTIVSIDGEVEVGEHDTFTPIAPGFDPDIASGKEADLAGWLAGGDGHVHVYVSRRPDGGDWDTPMRLDDDDDHDAADLRLSSDWWNAYAIWTQDGHVRARRRASDVWGPIADLGPGSAPQIAWAGQSDGAIAAWIAPDGSVMGAYIDEATWTTAIALHPGGGAAADVHVSSAGADGVVVWREGASVWRTVWSEPCCGWIPARRLDDGTAGTIVGLDVDGMSDVAIWSMITADGSHSEVVARGSDPASTPVILDSADGAAVSAPRIAGGPVHGIASWSIGGRVEAARYDGGWLPATELDQGDATDLVLAVTDNHIGEALWRRDGKIVRATFE